jgi:hypothetical protein
MLCFRLVMIRNPTGDIADRNCPDEVPIINHGEVAKAFFGEQGHRFFDRRVRRDRHDIRGHNAIDRNLPRVETRADNTTEHIAFSENAD